VLYVAMTRAKTDLHLMAPLKYYVTQQSRMGDKHVYGAKSRFLTAAVMACMQPVSWSALAPEAHAVIGNAPSVDVGAKLRGLWS
jgi:DNA helicase-2/ATP-dependent DNA helicase PcrA